MKPVQCAPLGNDQEARRYLQIGAIVGRQFNMLVVAYVARADIQTAQKILQRAEAAGVIEQVKGTQHQFTYRHALVQRNFAKEISESDRRRLHGRILRALETLAAHSSDYVLAYHAFESALRGKMRLYGERAGDGALRLGAAADAARYYAAALSASRAPATQDRLRRKLQQAQGASDSPT